MKRVTFSIRTIRYGFFAILLFGACGTKEPAKRPLDAQVPIMDTVPLFTTPLVSDTVIAKIVSGTPVLEDYKAGISSFYSRRSGRCAWFNAYGLTEQSGIIMNQLRSYIHSGIADSSLVLPGVMDYYNVVSDAGFLPEDHDSVVAYADVLFTGQFFMFAERAWKGVGTDVMRQLEWYIPAKQLSVADYLDGIVSGPPGKDRLREPVHIQYSRLKEKIVFYNAIVQEGGWNLIPVPADTLWPGISSGIIAHIRKRLVISGDLTGDTASDRFDEPLAEAIVRVRESFGLSPEKRIDRALVSALNVSAETRLRQMLLNLERWKWMPDEPPPDLIVVNIPDFKLHVFEKGNFVRSMKVIVGASASKTVIFSGALSEVVFSPYWVIPAGILQSEILPAIQRDPSYLQAHRLEVVGNAFPYRKITASSISWKQYNGYNFPYTIRQLPGPSNALGRVKFLFPNEYSIYLHDTPVRNLFDEQKRMFSHGCIRVAEPVWLSAYLLRNDPSWNAARIEEAMSGGTEIRVRLHSSVPVRITYFTSWVDATGRVHFRDDVYHHDRKLEKLILTNP